MDLAHIQDFIMWAVAALLGFGGSFLGSYFKTKGENLATHEDIGKLLDQVSAVTTTTKEIEAKISNEVWDRQKHWELRRDAVFDVLKSMGHVEDALTTFHSICKTDEVSSNEPSPERIEKRTMAFKNFNDAANDLDRAGLMVGLVCGDGLRHQLLDLGLFTRDMADTINRGHPGIFNESIHKFVSKSKAIVKEMRAALRIEIPISLAPTVAKNNSDAN
jgi:hypothetical protein